MRPMSRGAWRNISVLIALVVAAALGWQLNQFYQSAEQEHASYSYQPSSKPGFRIDAATKSPTKYYKPSCNNPNTNSDSDLCAQWAAVDQASESNRLSVLNVRLAVFVALLTAIGTYALIWTLFETWTTSRAELRAYVAAEWTELRLNGETGRAQADVKVMNDGQTPAFNTVWAGNIVIRTLEQAERDIRATTAANHPPQGRAAPMTINGSKSSVAGFEAEPPLDPEELQAAIWGEELKLFLFGTVWYDDAFGKHRHTNFSFVANRLPLPDSAGHHDPWDGGFEMTPFHNDSN
jgi:hypothetical protein